MRSIPSILKKIGKTSIPTQAPTCGGFARNMWAVLFDSDLTIEIRLVNLGPSGEKWGKVVIDGPDRNVLAKSRRETTVGRSKEIAG